MDRNMVYPGAIPLDTDVLTVQRSIMKAFGFLAKATLGATTCFDGLICTQTTVPSMAVTVSPGSAVLLSTVDATSFGSLAADTTDALVKMGINLTATTLNVTAPVTSGQSVNYLIEAAMQETDTTSVVLPYYNSANPAVPYSGPANSGTPQNTQRLQTVSLQAKAGTPATTGTQTTPAADSGYTGLWVVTVAFGASSVVNANISMLNGAPFVDAAAVGRGVQPGRLINVQTFTSGGTYTPTPGMNKVIFEVQAAGGGGAGAAQPSAGNVSLGAAGTSGGYAKALLTASAVGASQAISVGSGGGGGGATGGTGGNASVGSLIVATGGVGGGTLFQQAAPTVNGNGNNTAASTGGNILSMRGGGVSPTVAVSATAGFSGLGGASVFGPGGYGVAFNTNGPNALNPGAGGGGCVCNNGGGGAYVGGAGANGIVIAYEYS